MSTTAFVRWVMVAGFSGGLAAQVFAPPVAFPVAAPTSFGPIMVGDVDLDGHLDVVVSDDGARAHTFLGTGTGSFAPPLVSTGAASLVVDAQLHDLDGDGRLDLLVAGVFPQLRWLAGDGSGTFVRRAEPSGVGSRVAVFDLDGDGRPDLVGRSGSALAVARGSDNGFLPATPVPLPTSVVPPFSVSGILVGDLDGDANDDLVISGFGLPIAVFGDGRGGFDRGATLPNTLFLPRALTDVDGDGDLDVVSEFPSARARIGFFDEVAGFTVVELPGSPSTAITMVAAVDLDGDGTEDVLTIAGNEIVVLRSDGTGGYAVADRHVVPGIETLAVGDFDEDGRADVVAVGNSAMHYLHNELGTPRGLTAYGTGTATCRGTIGMTGDRTPVIGSSSFRVLCSNAPANAAGLLLVGTRRTAGIEVPGLQLVLHLGIAWPLAAMHSDVSGSASVALPLPRQPWLSGLSVHVQSFWMADASSGDTCSRAVLELASSRGLSITLQR